MLYIDYPSQITQTLEEFSVKERSCQDKHTLRRLSFLRLLKSGHAKTIGDASEIVGIHPATGQKVWKKYQVKGLEEVAKVGKKGRRPKLSDAEKGEVLDVCGQQGFMRLVDAQSHIKEKHGKALSISSIHYFFKKNKVKAKMPRPKNYLQQQGAVEGFKKNGRPS